MDLPNLPPDFSGFGFADPTPQFVRIVTSEEPSGRALVDGVVVIPGLPVCRVRMKTDPDRLDRRGPGREALLAYVRAALHEDVMVELPWN
jgi:hypothetical protein